MFNQKQLENVEYFNYFGSLITDDVKCTCEIKSRAATTKAAFNKKKVPPPPPHQQIVLKFKNVPSEMLYSEHSSVVRGPEIWTLQKVDQKYLESFEVQCWRMMRKINCMNHVKNQEVLQRVRKERNILTYLLTAWSRVLLEKLTSKLCS